MGNTENANKSVLDPTNTKTTVDDQNSGATTETTVPAGDNEQPPINFELLPNVVTVDKDQLEELMDQNITMKTEIGQLVSLFQIFEGLISGKSSVTSLMLLLPKLMNNPEIGKQIADIHPIIEKYTETP